MTETEKEYIEKDLNSLFPDSQLIHNNTRQYKNFTIAKSTNFTIAFEKDTESSTVEYMLIKKD